LVLDDFSSATGCMGINMLTKGPEPAEALPVMRPMLPTADDLLPYLRRIDAARVYSNFGPLAAELQDKLTERLRLPVGSVVATSSGTTALMAAILSVAGPATRLRPYALIPAFTFAATGVAAERCGYQGYLADIDASTWMLDPESLAGHPALEQVGVIIPVAPYGRPVAQSPWLAFRERTGIPVVIDAAASFDCVYHSPGPFFGEIPVVMSFHATKIFGTGEGGCVVSTNAGMIERAGQALNFGIHMTRESASPSLNGKMSEYHAAVGLAELDGWRRKQDSFQQAAARYRQSMEQNELLSRFFVWPDISACYALYLCSGSDEVTCVQEELRRAKIDFRFWYGAGLHAQIHFANNPHGDLHVTENIGRRLIGLPMAIDIWGEAVSRVASAVRAGVKGAMGR
jgi:dTDP-4-amino-4,6-dideoxygalactose transaminase